MYAIFLNSESLGSFIGKPWRSTATCVCGHWTDSLYLGPTLLLWRMTFRLLYYDYYVLVCVWCSHSMCLMIVGGGGGSQPVVGWGGSRSPRIGLFRVCLRERGHFGKLGLGLVLFLVPSDHRLGLSGASFSGWHFSAGGDSVAPDLVLPVTSVWVGKVLWCLGLIVVVFASLWSWRECAEHVRRGSSLLGFWQYYIYIYRIF